MTRLTKLIIAVLIIGSSLFITYGQLGIDFRGHQLEFDRLINELPQKEIAVQNADEIENVLPALVNFHNTKFSVAKAIHQLDFSKKYSGLFSVSGGILLLAGVIILIAAWGARKIPSTIQFYRNQTVIYLTVVMVFAGIGLAGFGWLTTAGGSEYVASQKPYIQKQINKISVASNEAQLTLALRDVDGAQYSYGLRATNKSEELQWGIYQILVAVGIIALASMLTTIPYERKRAAAHTVEDSKRTMSEPLTA